MPLTDFLGASPRLSFPSGQVPPYSSSSEGPRCLVLLLLSLGLVPNFRPLRQNFPRFSSLIYSSVMSSSHQRLPLMLWRHSLPPPWGNALSDILLSWVCLPTPRRSWPTEPYSKVIVTWCHTFTSVFPQCSSSFSAYIVLLTVVRLKGTVTISSPSPSVTLKCPCLPSSLCALGIWELALSFLFPYALVFR